jgi:hypothetical protein
MTGRASRSWSALRTATVQNRLSRYDHLGLCRLLGDAPDFVEVGEAGIAVDHAMRR